MLKVCVECNIEKDENEFSASQFKKKSGRCKLCISNYNKIYRLKNKEKLNKYDREFRINNKEDIADYKKEYYISNIDKVRKYQYAWEKNRKIINPQFKLRKLLSSSIYYHLNCAGSSKQNNSILKYLPYSIQELKEHLEKLFESWMTWNNWGTYNKKIWNDNDPATWTWQIDHIIPHSTFQYASMEDEEFNKCWSLNNLRPLSAKQNFLVGFLPNRRL